MLHLRRLPLVSITCLVAYLTACGDVSDPSARVVIDAPTSSSTMTTTTTTPKIDWQKVAALSWRVAADKNAAADRRSSPAMASPATRQLPPPAVSAPRYSHITFSSAMPDNLKPFFACVAVHESGGNYQAVNPSGKYRGRYQMDRSFWRTHAPDAWKHMADSRDWEYAPAEVQDATAVTGYHNQGPQAWSGPNGSICVEYRI